MFLLKNIDLFIEKHRPFRPKTSMFLAKNIDVLQTDARGLANDLGSPTLRTSEMQRAKGVVR